MTNELENAQGGDAQQAVKPANMRWYTLHVYSSMEKSVAKSLRERIDRSELKDQFGEVLLPIEKVEENRNGKRMETERRMYPGYVFVEMVMSEETWHLIKIQERMSSGQAKARPKVMFEAGERVRIKSGAFADFEGRVDEVLYDKSRLRCFVSIFGRETSVELAFNEVEKL